MITDSAKNSIITIWDNYAQANRKVQNTKGKVISNIDEARVEAIKDVRGIISSFLKGELGIGEFKTSLDGYNKRNNLWGFTATKGQMFFNQLTRTNENSLEDLSSLLKQVITEPKDLQDALLKIGRLEGFAREIFSKGVDKRKVPNPSSTGYFLSYFWQIHNPVKWPIMYTSLIEAFSDLGIWQYHETQKEAYEAFYQLNEEIKSLLSTHSKKEISNWDAEHAFWNLKIKSTTIQEPTIPSKTPIEKEVTIKATFDLKDYLIPKISNLIELGNSNEKSGSSKGNQFEKLVADIFKFLDFDIEPLGQGTGRNPDLIAKFKEEHTAFLVDAKAYGNAYTLGIDDRAIKEYINHYCPKLQKEGFKKIGFIIVSNSFKSNFESFVNEITWNTEIKRFIFLTSEALLHLLAYKFKDKLSLGSIIDCLVSSGSVITSQSVIEEFDDY
jgi:hypothetical protein